MYLIYTRIIVPGLSSEVAELMRRVRTVVGARARLAGVGGVGMSGKDILFNFTLQINTRREIKFTELVQVFYW